jgi:cell division protein FtsA
MLPAGVILTGAASKIPGALDLARETLNLPVQIGFPQNFEGVVDKIDDPAYATAIGLILWGSRFDPTYELTKHHQSLFRFRFKESLSLFAG